MYIISSDDQRLKTAMSVNDDDYDIQFYNGDRFIGPDNNRLVSRSTKCISV